MLHEQRHNILWKTWWHAPLEQFCLVLSFLSLVISFFLLLWPSWVESRHLLTRKENKKRQKQTENEKKNKTMKDFRISFFFFSVGGGGVILPNLSHQMPPNLEKQGFGGVFVFVFFFACFHVLCCFVGSVAATATKTESKKGKKQQKRKG